MDIQLFNKFAPIIQSLTTADFNDGVALKRKMQISEEGKIQTCYAPFDFVNLDARIVLVGITPGLTQMVNAIKEAKVQLDRGADPTAALAAAKKVGAFSGKMRTSLVEMLNHVGVQHIFGISTCDEFFAGKSALVHTTSLLRYPVFANGENYDGSPSLLRTPALKAMFLNWFAQEAALLPNAVFVPLGSVVSKIFRYAADTSILQRTQILDGMPHPSPANSERIKYFLERKNAKALCNRTNAGMIDRAREQLIRKVSELAA